MTVLLVEDDASIAIVITAALEAEGFVVMHCDTIAARDNLLSEQRYQALVTDVMLPDGDGIETLGAVHERFPEMPIIILSARDQENQKIHALDNGADDYLTKPFSTGELLARIRVALRHAAQRDAGDAAPTMSIGELTIDFASRRITVGAKEIHLTPIEYKVLTTLARHAGKVLTHRFLLNEVWGPNHSRENHYLRVFMASLRRKLETDSAQPRYLLTEQGVGYRMAAE